MKAHTLNQIENTCGFDARCLAAQSPAAPAPTTATAKGEELMMIVLTKSAMFVAFVAHLAYTISSHYFLKEYE